MSRRRIALAASRRAEHRQLVGRQIAVDVDQGHRRGRRNPQLAAGESGPCRCALRRPGRPSRHRRAHRRARETAADVPRSARQPANGLSASRASGRFHGSAPGMRSRVTSMVIVCAFADARRAARQQIFRPTFDHARPRCGRWFRCSPACAAMTLPAGVSPVEHDPRFDDLAVLDQRARVSPIPRSISHSGNVDSPADFSSTRVSASGRPTTLE